MAPGASLAPARKLRVAGPRRTPLGELGGRGTDRELTVGMQTGTNGSNIGHRLAAHHRELDALFDKLLLDMHGGDSATCQATWSRFERALLDHIEAEEVFLLPSFDGVHGREATIIRQEHAEIRHLLADMGVRLELHAVREEHVEKLIEALRKHAEREERLLYPWAEKLAPDLAISLMHKLSDAPAQN